MLYNIVVICMIIYEIINKITTNAMITITYTVIT